MSKIVLTVNHKVGLHARPASMFVQTVNRFKSEVFVTCGERTANAKSIIGVLGLGVNRGAVIEITAEGSDADEALSALKLLVENNFSTDGEG